MVRAKRQPGSTLKPFVYALAFANGHSAAEPSGMYPRLSQTGGTYAPGNFDGTFEGPLVPAKIGWKFECTAVRLAAEIGESRLLEALLHVGFTSLDQNASHYGLALALGAGE